MSGNWKKGRYTVLNPDKYLGDPENVIYRSSWEEEAFKRLDLNPDVLRWCSEEIAIEYPKPNPQTGQLEQGFYFPDLFIVKQELDGKITRDLIEIKPYKQTIPPRSRKPSVRLQEEYQWLVNQHKWAAAEEWCKRYGINFRIMTEKDMFL